MNLWDKVKKDVQKGLKEGMEYVKAGAGVVKKKAGQLSDEGQKRLKALELKARVYREMADLGGKVYHLSGSKENPLQNAGVKDVIGKVSKMEAQIARLEGATGKKAAKKKAKKKAKKP
ncbi:MAG: hypothetical protein A2072_06790 [Nitrospirae bacterium GWC1_57_7]|nr:MAG: hypothetical protein A2072_06790 [Nitrospirae bacterium GWC1_57_7]